MGSLSGYLQLARNAEYQHTRTCTHIHTSSLGEEHTDLELARILLDVNFPKWTDSLVENEGRGRKCKDNLGREEPLQT